MTMIKEAGPGEAQNLPAGEPCRPVHGQDANVASLQGQGAAHGNGRRG